MTNEPMVHAAEERLLDAALVQVFASGRGKAAVRRTPRLLLAALFLLGLTVTAATMWQARGARTEPRDEAQDPGATSIHEEVKGEGRAGIEALPVTTTNLLAKLVDPRDLQVVTRFENLRALRLWSEKSTFLGIPTGYHGSWRKPPGDLLQPLGHLKELEVLRLPHELALSAELLGPLAGHPTLREIQFVVNTPPFDEAFVEALTRIPHLRRVHLHLMPIPADALRALAKLPLESLQLDFCRGLDADGWQALRSMRSLQRLAIKDWSWHVERGRNEDPPGWKPSPAELRGLRDLPKLRALELPDCSVDDEQLAALPDTLTTLHLFGTALTPAGFRSLRRFGQLRDLVVDTRHRSKLSTLASLFESDREAEADATASALSTLRLRSLRFVGALTPDLVSALESQSELQDLSIESQGSAANSVDVRLQRVPLRTLHWHAPVSTELLAALAKQPRLSELTLVADDFPNLAPLATAPALQQLTLTSMRVGSAVQTADIAPLARSLELRDLRLHFSVFRGEARPSLAELQRAVGERIRLIVGVSEFARGK